MVRLQVGYIELPQSRAFMVQAYPQQTHEMQFSGQQHAFRVLGGDSDRVTERPGVFACPQTSHVASPAQNLLQRVQQTL